ncbi:hypothetical protein ACJJTC_006209, partial [Scirpophaga incertulas]
YTRFAHTQTYQCRGCAGVARVKCLRSECEMKLTTALLLLAAVSHAAEQRGSSKRQRNQSLTTDKRELGEGNAGVEKRAPILATVSPSSNPGIEYADTKETHADKSPSQQIYATPVPQIAKISDLLTGQGPPYQAAIASHLYAPVSIYQTRLGSPRTYEVSSPIASQLAYSEHKISYQPPQNALQYNPQQYSQKLPVLKQANFVRPVNLQQPYQQQILVPPQTVIYSQQPQLLPQTVHAQQIQIQPPPLPYSEQPHLLPIPSPPIYQQLPQIPFQVPRPLQYFQQPSPPQQIEPQSLYTQEQQNLIQVVPAQAGIVYANEEQKNIQGNEQPRQQLKPAVQQVELRIEQQPSAPVENKQTPGPVSYASFSQSQPAQAFAQPSPLQYQALPQQYTPQLYRAQPQTQQQIHYQIQSQIPQQIPAQNLHQIQPQIQYQTQQTPRQHDESLTTASSKSHPISQGKQLSFFRPGPVLQTQPRVVQSQAYQQTAKVFIPSSGHGTSSSLSLTPTYPSVQYFGKFAQSIFGGSYQQ